MHADVNALSQPQTCCLRPERVSALCVAAKRGHLQTVKVLLRRGADWTLARRAPVSSNICGCLFVRAFKRRNEFKEDTTLTEAVRDEINKKALLYQTPSAAMKAYIAAARAVAEAEELPSSSSVLLLSDEEEDDVFNPSAPGGPRYEPNPQRGRGRGRGQGSPIQEVALANSQAKGYHEDTGSESLKPLIGQVSITAL